MSWDDCVASVRADLPQFNNKLLIDYPKAQINSAPEFMDNVFKESVRFLAINVPVEYKGYRILRPQEQIQYLLGSSIMKHKVNIRKSELQLVEYKFVSEGREIDVHLYLPYLYNNVITIDDTKYAPLNNIIDKFIVRSQNKIIIRVMKIVMQFWRNKQYRFRDVDGENYNEVLVTVVAINNHRKKSSFEWTVVLYLLAEFGFKEAMRRLFSDLTFVSEAKLHDEDFQYFEIIEGIYLKATRKRMKSEMTYRRVVAAILYSLLNFKDCIISIQDLYDPFVYRAIFGKIWKGKDCKTALAASHCENHLKSTRIALDETAIKNMYAEKRLMCENTFDLLTHVFFNIDDWLLVYSPNDLFEKRLSGIATLFEKVISVINNKFYKSANNKKIGAHKVKETLRFDAMMIRNIYCLKCVQANPSAYNDNELFSKLIKKKRPNSGNEKTGKKKSNNTMHDPAHQFSPSFLAIESIWSISSSAPGVSGDINPYVEIDENGEFLKDKMPWYKDIESIQEFFPRI